MVSCRKMEIEPIPQPKSVSDIFSQTETTISNGDEIMFKLNSDSTYILKLVDKSTNQVISKEKIVGKVGENKLTMYTKSIQSRYLYLVLEGMNKNQINKTTIILN
jgi:6-phosphogluconolactonase/glucosamine-6-phosphate isomerase/deaminase